MPGGNVNIYLACIRSWQPPVPPALLYLGVPVFFLCTPNHDDLMTISPLLQFNYTKSQSCKKYSTSHLTRCCAISPAQFQVHPIPPACLPTQLPLSPTKKPIT